MRLPNVDAVSKQQYFVGAPYARKEESGPGATSIPDTARDGKARDKRWNFKLPSLRGPAREERAQERERQKELESAEAAKQAFFQTPAGRARLAYKQGHRLFQYQLKIDDLQPLLIPGLPSSPSRETADPVDILNSVVVEGWKLVSGKFIHSEMSNGVIGCYLFKRSQKRRLRMSNPWQS